MNVVTDDWIEWKTICSVTGCSSEARIRLANYVQALYATHLKAYATVERSEDIQDAPHIFDYHMAVKETQGKPLKDWMFERSVDDRGALVLQHLNSNAKILLRDAVRIQLSQDGNLREKKESRNVYLTDRAGADSSSVLFQDMLPGEYSYCSVWGQDTLNNDLLEELAGRFVHELEPVDATILAAFILQIPFNSPSLERLLGIKKSAVSSRFKDNIGVVGLQVLQDHFPELRGDTHFFFSGVDMINLLHRPLLAWVKGLPLGPKLLEMADPSILSGDIPHES